MTLNDLKSVIIDERGGYKFIVVKVSDGDNSRLIVRANQGCDYHADIFEQVCYKTPELKMWCIGGGRIDVNPEAKTIKIWDSSGSYGVEPDRSQTVRILREAYPDYEVIGETPRW